MADYDAAYDAPPVYIEAADPALSTDERVVYRASSLGACLGMLARCRAGLTPAPPPDLMLERYQEGHDAEAQVKAAGLGVDWLEITDTAHLSLYGTVTKAASGVQVAADIAWGNKVVRCHPDGLATHRGSLEKRVVEVKFLGDDMMNRILSDTKKYGASGLGNFYSWQTSVEMLATGLPLLLIIGRKKVTEVDGARVVELADDGVEVLEFDEPAYSLSDIKARVAQVEGAARRAEDGGGWPACPVPFDYPCGFWAEHDTVAADEIEDEELTSLMLSYLLLKSAADAQSEQAAAVKEKIHDRLIDLHITTGTNSGYTLTVTGDRPGNVSWSKAYKALAKETGVSVDEDEYRGEQVKGGVTLRAIKK